MRTPKRLGHQHYSAYDIAKRFGQQLKTCPFCHSGNIAMYMGLIPNVECLNCGAEGPRPEGLYSEDRLFNAVILWNTREEPERNERLEEPRNVRGVKHRTPEGGEA